MCEDRNDLAFDWDSLPVNFLVQGLTQSDRVLKAFGCELSLLMAVEPEVDMIEKMKAHSINYAMSLLLIFGSEEKRSSKNALESFDM